jgi:hypothetical protein
LTSRGFDAALKKEIEKENIKIMKKKNVVSIDPSCNSSVT